MSPPVVITCAITGSQTRKSMNPAVPITPAEQIESTHEAFEAGGDPPPERPSNVAARFVLDRGDPEAGFALDENDRFESQRFGELVAVE